MDMNELVDAFFASMQNIGGIEKVSQIDIVKASVIVAGLMMEQKGVKEIECDEFIISITSK